MTENIRGTGQSVIDAPSASISKAVLDRLARLAGRLVSAPSARATWAGNQAGRFGTGLAAVASRAVESMELRVLTGGRPVTGEIPADGADATWGSYLGVPLFGEAGIVRGCLSVGDRPGRRWDPGDVEALRDLAAAFEPADGARSGPVALERAARQEAESNGRHYRDLAEVMPQMIWVTRPDGYHEYYNTRWYEYTGLGVEQSAGSGWQIPLHPDDRERSERCWRQATLSGTPYEIEYRFRRHDGTYRWFLGRALPLRDASGRVIRWFGTCTDIDEQKRTLEELERTKARAEQNAAALRDQLDLTRTVAENNALALFLVDRERRCTYANPAAEALLGRPLEEFLGRRLHDLIHHHHPDGRPYPIAECPLDRSSAAGREIRAHQDHFIRADGTFFPVLCSVTPFERRGEFAGAVISVRDMTEVKEAEQALAESQDRLRLAAEATGLGIWDLELATGTLQWSPRCKAIFGLAPDDPIDYGRFLERVHPDDVARVDEAVARALDPAGDGGYDLEYRVVWPDGTQREVEAKGRSFFDGEGPARRAVRFVGTALDITPRKQAERQLEAAEALVQSARDRSIRILESIADAFFALDRNWRFTYINPQAEPLLRRSRDELYGRVVWDEFPEAVGSSFEAHYREAVETGRPVSFEEHYAPLSRWFEVRAYPSADGLSVYFRDITARKQAERALAEAHRRRDESLALLDSLLANAPIGFACFDESYRYLRVNRFLAEVNGLSVEDHQGRTLRQVVPANAEQVEPVIDRVLRTGEPALGLEISGETPARPGERRTWLTGYYPVWFGDDRPSCVGVVVVEITERRRAEEEVLRLNRDLEDRVRARTEELEHANSELQAFTARLECSNRELQEFASVASHDLQEPLRKIQAFGDRLESRSGAALGPEGRDYLERMRNAAGRMRNLIDDLLAFSQVATKAQPFAAVDLGQIAREVASDLEGRVAQTGGRIEIGPLPTLDADPTQMRQLLQNLIGNGLKFHRPGVPPVIRVVARVLPDDDPDRPGLATDGPCCEIAVEDNGIGFDEKYLDRIFNVFQRLHGRTEYEGTGMGLAICRKIVERHGGVITARSAPEQGATFHVLLPLSQAQSEDRP